MHAVLLKTAPISFSPVLAFHLTFRTALKALPPKSHRLSVPRRQHASFSVFESDGYEKEIEEILDVVKEFEEKFNKKIPVVFGGGIFDKKDIEHYLSLGLSGVQMATRFVATKECDASDAFKNMYVKAKEGDVTIVQSPVHMPGRALLNPFVKAFRQHRIPVTNCFHCLKTCDPATTPYCISMALIRAVRGDVDHGLVFSGANSWKIDKITTVHDLIQELTQDPVDETIPTDASDKTIPVEQVKKQA